MFDYPFNFLIIIENWKYFVEGIGLTLLITFISLFGSFVIGIIVGLIRLKAPLLVSIPFAIYVDFFRSTPILIQLIWFYYALPVFLGVSLNPWVAGFLTLALHAAASLSEIFRGGFKAISRGQTEAAFVLGLSSWQTFRWILFPQAVKIMIPPIASMAVVILKQSSLLAVINAMELTYRGQLLSSITFHTLEIFSVVGVLYFVLTYPLIIVANFFEKRAKVTERL